MTEISSPFREPSPLLPRTAKYVAALIREGDSFDYCKWLQRVREEEDQAKQARRPFFRPRVVAKLEIESVRRVAGMEGRSRVRH